MGEIRKFIDSGADFFDENPIMAMRNALQQHEVQVSSAIFTQNMVKEFGATSGKGMSAARFYKKMGLSEDVAPKNVNIPDSIVKDMQQTGMLFSKGSGIATLLAASSTINKIYRLGLTTPFPAFHVRNAIGDTLNQTYDGFKLGSQVRMKANVKFKLQAVVETSSDGRVKDVWNKLLAIGVRRTGAVAVELVDIISKQSTDNPFKKLLKHIAKKPLGETLSKVIPSGTDAATAIEDNAKIAHYFYAKGITAKDFKSDAWIKKALSDSGDVQAVQRTNKYLFDYGDITPFEKGVARESILFYTWLRKNIPLQIETALSNPKIAAHYYKFARPEFGELPEYLIPQGAIPLTKLGLDIKNKAISTTFMPINDLFAHFSIGDADPNFFAQMSTIASRGASLLAPIPKTAFELSTGVDAFTKRPLKNLTGLEFLGRRAPTSRLTRSLEDAIDLLSGKLDAVSFISTQITGIRVRPFSSVTAEIDAVKRAIKSSLPVGSTGEIVIPFSRKDKFGEPIDTEADRLLKLQSQVIRKLQKKRKFEKI